NEGALDQPFRRPAQLLGGGTGDHGDDAGLDRPPFEPAPVQGCGSNLCCSFPLAASRERAPPACRFESRRRALQSRELALGSARCCSLHRRVRAAVVRQLRRFLAAGGKVLGPGQKAPDDTAGYHVVHMPTRFAFIGYRVLDRSEKDKLTPLNRLYPYS